MYQYVCLIIISRKKREDRNASILLYDVIRATLEAFGERKFPPIKAGHLVYIQVQ